MAGITDWPFRLLAQREGADETCTEMVSAQGYLCAPKDMNVYRFLLQTHPQERRVYVQVFGHDPKLIGEACRRLSAQGSYAGIDINMGCPAQKVTSSGSGSALMKDLRLAGQVIRAAVEAAALPVSVKMRLGWDDASINAPELAHIAQEEGTRRITVHGRTRQAQYGGKADWQQIARVCQSVTIPVLANGDIFSPADARQALAITGCAGLMVGRGALGDPWLFGRMKAELAGQEGPLTPPADILKTALWHCDTLASWKGERTAVLEMRKHFAWYLKGMRGAARLRSRLNAMEDLAQVKEHLSEFFAQAGD